jgi:hypothetical protein
MTKNIDAIITNGENKYKTGVNTEDYKKGVNATKVAPSASAIKEKERFKNNTIAGEASMISSLQNVNESERQQKAIEAFPVMQENAIKAVDSGKWNADKVLNASKASNAAAEAIPKGGLDQSYKRFKAATDSTKTSYGVKK